MSMTKPERIRIDLCDGWEFQRTRVSSAWLSGSALNREALVNLPHCWNSQDAFQDGVAYYRGSGAYKRAFELTGHERALEQYDWRLESEGFYGTGEVWLNGQRISKIDGQYIGFSLPVETAQLKAVDNIIGLRLTNKCRSHVLPGNKMPDFLLYGGMSGRVSLVGLPKCRIDESSVKVINGDAGDLEVSFTVLNSSGEKRNCMARCIVVDDGGNVVGQEEVDGVSGGVVVRVSVENPKLWSCESPNLYTVRCVLLERDQELDAVEVRYGIRTAEFRAGEGFYLNGKRVELRGCNRHESMPGFGNALPDQMHVEDALVLKKMGCNFVRLSHYPQHPVFLNACDAFGILVYAEIASWKSVRRGRWLRNAARQFRDMILRDRNHPSVILWGMGNESRSRKAYTELASIAHFLDADRPVIYAENHMYRARRQKTIGMADVWGSNYELDMLKEGMDASKLKAVLVSECSNYPHTKRGSEKDELLQVELIKKDLAEIRRHAFVSGFSLWCYNDYATLRKERYKRYSGLVDAWRMPKMSSALLCAMHLDEPFVKVFAEWTEEGKAERDVNIFSNCDEVSLFKADEPEGSFVGDVHYNKSVQFADGDLVVKGVKNGVVVEDRIKPYGEAARIDVWVEKVDSEKAGVVSVMIRILDDRGHHVLDWMGHVDVDVSAGGVLRGYRKDSKIDVAGGVGRAFVDLDRSISESVRVDVRSGALIAGEIVISR